MFYSQPIETAALTVVVISFIATLLAFWWSEKLAFRLFLLSCASVMALLSIDWYSAYKLGKQRDALILPIVENFSPFDVADGLKITDMSWDGRTLSHHYEALRSDLIPNHQQAKIQTCSGLMRIELLALGGVIAHHYTDQEAAANKSGYRFSVLDCFDDG